MDPRQLVVLGWCCIASSAALGDIYQWSDEAGQPQYSTMAPSKRPYRVLRPAPQISDEEQRRAQERLQKDLQQLQALESARRKAAEDAYREQQERAERASRCEEAKLQLRFLQETQALRWVEPDTGGHDIVRWLDDEEKDRVMQGWHQHTKATCASAGTLAPQAPSRPQVVAPPPYLKKAVPVP